MSAQTSPNEALLRAVVRAALRLSFKLPSRLPLPVGWLRAGMEASAALFPMVAGVQRTSGLLGGVPTDSFSLPTSQGVHILHLHGGAFFTGSRRTHAALASELCHRSGGTVHLIDYRLAPEHPWPAAPQDVMQAWQALRKQGVAAERIVVSGDSAGGALALGLAQELRDLGEPGPAALLLISPFVDLTLTASSVSALASTDPMVTEVALRRGSDAYRGSLPASDPRVSPLMGDLRDLPPTLVQVGSDEILLDDAIELERRATQQGSTVALQNWAGAWHDFQLFARVLPSADQALDELARWAVAHARPRPHLVSRQSG
jgi:monoterpene epsilon-lactone hydrolase